MSLRGNTKRRGMMAEMNVVPYIDVMLVLVVILMVAAPFVNPSVVNLPSVNKASKAPEQVIEVIVYPDSRLSIRQGKDMKPVDIPGLVAAVKTAQGEKSNIPVVIAADKDDRETNDRFRKEDRRDMVPAAVLSGCVHVILFVGLFSVFQWTTDSETVYAELWAPEPVSGGNDPKGVAVKPPEAPEPKPNEIDEQRESQEAQEAAEREAAAQQARMQEEAAQREAQRQEALAAAERERVEAEKAAEEAREAEEARRAEEARVAAERAEAERIEKARQDAIEAERRAEEKRAQQEAERLAQEKLAQERKAAEEARLQAEARRQEEARLAEEKRLAEAKRAEEARIAEEKRQAEIQRVAAEKKAAEERRERERIRQAIRQQELARLNAKIDPDSQRSGTPSGDKRNQRQNLTGSALASYNARIIACVRPNISIDVPSSTRRGQFIAEFVVRPMPNGELAGAPVYAKKSGWDAYDSAVRNAILKCKPFPVPEKGYNIPKEVRLRFDPVDDRH